MMFVDMHLYDEAPAIGCGRRHVIITQQGPKWTKLLDPTTLKTATISTAIARDAMRQELPTHGLSAQLHAKRKLWKSLKRDFPDKLLKEVIETL